MSARAGRWLVAGLLTLAACQRAAAPVQPIPVNGALGEIAVRTLHPQDPSDEARRAIADRYTRRERRFREAWEPGSLWSSLRVEQQDIDAGRVTLPRLVEIGRELFLTDFTPAQGLGNGLAARKSPLAGGKPAPNLRHVHSGEFGGPDGTRCAGCHHAGGVGGGGFSADASFLDGDGMHPASGLARNPRSLFGAALIQKLAEEMSAELRAQAQNAARRIPRGSSEPLVAKGVQFGKLTVTRDGRLDMSSIRGVHIDLVVRPFGWKGTTATLRQAVAESLQKNLGIQAEELTRLRGAATMLGDGPPDDPDADGVTREATEGMVTALLAFIAALPPPIEDAPMDNRFAAMLPRGEQIFHEIGCASCHVPELPIKDTTLSLGPTERSRPRVDLEPLLMSAEKRERAATVRVYSDLRRHHMGDGLREHRGYRGVPPDQFITPPLWGIASSGPYLHDGRAGTIDQAILLHGGEAAPARAAYIKLSIEEGGSLRLFLQSLTMPLYLEFKP